MHESLAEPSKYSKLPEINIHSKGLGADASKWEWGRSGLTARGYAKRHEGLFPEVFTRNICIQE